MARYQALLAWIQRLPQPLSLLGVLSVVVAFWAALFGALYLSKLALGGVATLVLLGVVLTWFVATHQD